ncbi:MAG: hypothetical protein ACTSW1_07455 [Candidatus Hodarchaeales archaeon]
MKKSCTALAKMIREAKTLSNIRFVSINATNSLEGFISHLKSSCEAYGKNVKAYLECGTPEKRELFERWLRMNDITFNRKYWPKSSVVEVDVTYFKAWHHDE